MEVQTPLPKHVSWFAPWTWKRRWWCTMIGLLLVGYPFSVGPSYGLVDRCWLPMVLFHVVYCPLWLLANTNREVGEVLDWYAGLFSSGVEHRD